MLLRGGFHLYTLYLLFAIVSTAYSIAPLNSFVRALGSIVLFGGCYTITQSVKDNQDVRRLFGCLWAGCCITLIVSAASWAFLSSDITWVAPNPGSGDSVVRFIGILGNPNEVGEFLVLTMASGLFFWPIATKQVRFGIVTSLAAALLFTILADSRSHTVACAIGLFAFTLDRYRWRAIAVWLPLGVIAVGCALLLSPDKLDYLNRGDVMTLTGRTEIWRFTIDKIKERPILGYGYEVEGQIFQDRHFPLWEEMWETGPHIPVHNGYLSLAVGLGVPSLLFWLFFTLRPMVRIFGGLPDYFSIRDAILLGAIPVLALNFDESAFSDIHSTVALMLTLIWCIAERSRLLAKDQRRVVDGNIAKSR